MKKIILRVLGFSIFAIALLFLVYIKVTHDDHFSFIIPISAGLVVTMAAKPFIDSFFEAFVLTSPWKEKLYNLKKKKMISNKDMIYVSFSLQFRIMSNNKYFLVHSYRQKIFITLARSYLIDKEFQEEANKLGATFCNMYCHPNSKCDFKFLVPTNKLPKFVKLTEKIFNKASIEPILTKTFNNCLEFKEMHLTDGENVKCNLIGRYYKGVDFSRVDQRYTLIIYDICEVELNEKQQEEIAQYALDPNIGALFNSNEISRLGVIAEEGKYKANIGEHCEIITYEFESHLVKIK